MQRRIKIISTLLLLLWSSSSWAEIRLDLDATSIVGNRELPRIVYLMAWKEAPKGDILDQSLESNYDHNMVGLERDVFKRQISYHKLLFGEIEQNK